MAIDPTLPRTRRAVLAAALGAAAAASIDAVARPAPAEATTPPVVLGAANSANSLTSITNTTADHTAFSGTVSNSGTGLYGVSGSGYGVYGASTSSYGVIATSTSSYGVIATSTSGIGVSGSSDSGTLPAMVGRSGGDNTGVQGYGGPILTRPASRPLTSRSLSP